MEIVSTKEGWDVVEASCPELIYGRVFSYGPDEFTFLACSEMRTFVLREIADLIDGFKPTVIKKSQRLLWPTSGLLLPGNSPT